MFIVYRPTDDIDHILYDVINIVLTVQVCCSTCTVNTSCIVEQLKSAQWGIKISWPRGPMDKASDFESEDCEFESRRGHYFSMRRSENIFADNVTFQKMGKDIVLRQNYEHLFHTIHEIRLRNLKSQRCFFGSICCDRPFNDYLKIR